MLADSDSWFLVKLLSCTGVVERLHRGKDDRDGQKFSWSCALRCCGPMFECRVKLQSPCLHRREALGRSIRTDA